ncbi:MAG: phosphatidate cytidylyltransferase, partial [Oscillospiraceae bacterium]|nr:phosphatidate cytidylyltransferase [Oscillospiraceae bacterium]
IATAAILMWGFGDAAAALIGRRFGKHKIRHRFADPNKSWEGTAAMFATSAVVGAAVLLAFSAQPWYICIGAALAVSAAGAYTELVTKGGNDTVTVPVVNTALLLAVFGILN